MGIQSQGRPLGCSRQPPPRLLGLPLDRGDGTFERGEWNSTGGEAVRCLVAPSLQLIELGGQVETRRLTRRAGFWRLVVTSASSVGPLEFDAAFA
jgi:hypothetical protein